MLSNIHLLTDIYICSSFIFLFLVSIFCYLNSTKEYPNVYLLSCFFLCVYIFNLILIENQYCFVNINSNDIIYLDSSIIVKFIIYIITFIFILYSFFYIKYAKLQLIEFVIVIYYTLISFGLFIFVTDILSFYVILEIQSICFYLLTSFNKHNQYSVESGLKYFILSSFSSVCLLYGFSFIYAITGTLNIYDIFLCLSNLNYNFSNTYTISCIFIIIAFLFKLYVAPFHLWVGDIYQGAPTMSTAYFATVTSFPLFYVFIKLWILIFYWIHIDLSNFFCVISIISMLVGSFSALGQKKIKRLIALSSVSNIGYIMIGFIDDNLESLSYSVSYFLLYIINTIGLFTIFSNMYLLKFNTFIERFTLFTGLIKKNKLLSFFLISFLFVSIGMPPFASFYAKILIFTGLSYNLYTILLFVLVISAIVSAFYYLRIIKYMSFNTKSTWIHITKINYINGIIITYVFTFIIGINFNNILNISNYILFL